MGRLGGRQGRRLDIQRLVTQGDGSRSTRPRLDLKAVRTDRIQRRQQKGFLLTPPDSNSFLLRTPRWRRGCIPKGEALGLGRKWWRWLPAPRSALYNRV